ncbi:MAG: hypothetical protein KIT10_13240 [Flavobacteriales bacterium]|nr:hypothetical protein [Flavobacteriales bacterium]
MKPHSILLLALALTACEATDKRANSINTDKAAAPATPTRAEAIAYARARYDVERYFPGTAKDSLLVNMVTFIYKRPTTAINRDRTDKEFRPYYVKHAASFQQVYHHVSPDSTHWYYLIRPARSVEGDKRGVGGRFRTNGQLAMVEFEEIFNTRIMPEPELIDRGLVLFEEMVATGNVDAFLQDKTLIEWPDGRLYYDKEKREWFYRD